MKKLFLVFTIIVCFVGAAVAQDLGAPPPAKQKSIEELQWQAKALESEFRYLQERTKMVQIEFQAVQAELKQRQPTPTPKPAEKSKVEPDKKK